MEALTNLSHEKNLFSSEVVKTELIQAKKDWNKNKSLSFKLLWFSWFFVQTHKG